MILPLWAQVGWRATLLAGTPPYTNIAKDCGGPTRLLPVNRGTLVLLFRLCRTCEELAAKIAANTFNTSAKIASMEVREDWPFDYLQ